MKTEQLENMHKAARAYGCSHFDKVMSTKGPVYLGWGSRFNEEGLLVGCGYVAVDLNHHMIGRSIEFEPNTTNDDKRAILIGSAEEIYNDFADTRDESFWSSDRNGRPH